MHVQHKAHKKKAYAFRIVLCAIVFLLTVWGPWWFAFSAAALLILLGGYYEAVLFGILLDSMYVNQEGFLFSNEYLFTILLLIFTSASLLLKKTGHINHYV